MRSDRGWHGFALRPDERDAVDRERDGVEPAPELAAPSDPASAAAEDAPAGGDPGDPTPPADEPPGGVAEHHDAATVDLRTAAYAARLIDAALPRIDAALELPADPPSFGALLALRDRALGR